MKWLGNLLSCFALCVLFSGCSTDLPESTIRSSTSTSAPNLNPTSSSSVSETSSVSESTPLSSSSSADEDVVSWNSVLAQYNVIGSNPKGDGWYIWQNILEDTETITTLWNIVETAQSTAPHRYQYPPDGGFPFEVNFISDNVTIECSFFSQCVLVNGVWYEFTDDGYEEVMSLTGWNVK